MCDTMRNLLLCFVRIPTPRVSCDLSSELSVFGGAEPANGPRLLHTIPCLLLISAGFLLHFPDLCSLQVAFCHSGSLLTVIPTSTSQENGKVAAEHTIPLPLCYRASLCALPLLPIHTEADSKSEPVQKVQRCLLILLCTFMFVVKRRVRNNPRHRFLAMKSLEKHLRVLFNQVLNLLEQRFTRLVRRRFLLLPEESVDGRDNSLAVLTILLAVHSAQVFRGPAILLSCQVQTNVSIHDLPLHALILLV